MIGRNKVILSAATVSAMFEKYLKADVFKEGDFKITNIIASYKDQWEITLEGTEGLARVTINAGGGGAG